MVVNVPNSAFQVSQQSGSALYIVGFDVSLSQADVPYIVPSSGPLPQSETDLIVYGDTVTITGDLLNPGRTIAIYARQLIIGATTFISVAGADPLTSYTPGATAEQTNNGAGAAGAGGAAGSKGLQGGTITLAAESLQIQGPDTGAASPLRWICLQQAIAEAAAAAASSSDLLTKSLQFALPDFNFPFENVSVLELSGTVNISGISISGAPTVASISTPSFDASNSALSVTVALRGLTLAATAGITMQSPNFSVPGTISATFDLALEITFLPGTPPTTITPTTQQASIINLNLDFQMDTNFLDKGVVDAVDTDVVTPQLQAALPAPISAAVASASPNFAKAVSDLFLASVSNPALILLALGGAGGRGQDGHAGIQGATGASGQNTNDSVLSSQPPPSECFGGTGNPGGQGGDAGTSGTGGPGGAITVNFIKPTTIGIAADVRGGLGGGAADPGAPGPGGPGGPGGTYYVGVMYNFQQATAPAGAPGANGAAAASLGAMGTMGTAGQLISAPVTYDQLAPSLALYQLIFTQQAAKLAYLNAQQANDFENVIALYLWLQNITQLFNQTSLPVVAGLTASDIATRASINQAAALELGRMNAKLDYYGNPMNWAPVMTWGYLDGRVTQQISLCNILTQQFQAASQPSQQAQAARNAQTAIQNDLTNIQQEAQNLGQQINTLNGQIASLLTQMDQQIIIINKNFTTLQQQYTEQQAHCTFSDVLKALSSIVQIGLSAYLGVASELTLALNVAQAGADLLQKDANLVVSMQASDANYSALSAAWQSIQTALQQYGPNSALVAVADNQFDNLLNQYFGGLPEASVVEDDVNEFINLVQTRNQALLNYTSLYTRQQRLNIEYRQKQAELENIAALLAAQQQPQLPDYLAFLQSSLTQIGNDIVDNLYQENQAFQYWAVETAPFSVNGLDLGSLTTAANNLEGQVQKYLEGTTGRPFSSFQDISITVDNQNSPSAFARLAATNKLTFQIAAPNLNGPPDHSNPFTNTYNVTVETLSVSLPGITPPAGTAENPTLLQLLITQSGPDVMQSPSGAEIIFTHEPRPIIFEYNYTTEQVTITGTVGDSTQGYTGLSPFAIWTLDFSPPLNNWLTVSQLSSVQLTFAGTLLGPNASEEKKLD